MSLLFPALAALGLQMCSRRACAQSLLAFPDPSFNGLGFAQGPFLGEPERFDSSAELVDALRLSSYNRERRRAWIEADICCARSVDRSRNLRCARRGSQPRCRVRAGETSDEPPPLFPLLARRSAQGDSKPSANTGFRA